MHRVLVIEDDEELRRSIVESLAGCGFAVSEAADGAAGLERLRSQRADLIVLDLAMPGMDGQEFVRECRKLGGLADVPILISTGYIEAQVTGANARLNKPFKLEELLDAIRRCLLLGSQDLSAGSEV